MLSRPPAQTSLDPQDWDALRVQAHRMLDDMIDHVAGLGEGPVRRPIPDSIRGRFRAALPTKPAALADVHQEFVDLILPYGVGNGHPRFMGWVHGGGTVEGMLAEMLAAGLNANLGGRDQIPIEVERQVSRWMADLFGFPETASGLFVTGTSMANLIAVVIARTRTLGADSRAEGIAASPLRLAGYASAGVHNCVPRAFETSGIGAQALRSVPTDGEGRMDPRALTAVIAADRANGFTPFLLVGTAGTVDTGAIDPLSELADIAAREGLWLHIDGAVGALGMLSPDLAPKFTGIQRADSIAFDFHKWGQVPYDAGFILVRDRQAQLDAFASEAVYLRREARGLAGGSPWPCDFGPDLSRGFRALKAWFTLKVHGADAMGAMMLQTCRLAAYLAARIDASPELERLAPVALNIVCFRYSSEGDMDALNTRIVALLQDTGVAAPSTTTLDGRLAIRAAIVNHRTRLEDIDALVEGVIAVGRAETVQESQP